MDRLRAELVALAERHAGVILPRDLRSLGMDATELASAKRRLRVVRTGAYSPNQSADAFDAHGTEARAVARQYELAVAVSHVSAAVIHGMPVQHEHLDVVHVTAVTEGPRRGHRFGVFTHGGPLVEPDVVLIDGVPVTSPQRTVLDCARILPCVEGLVIADHALHARAVTLRELRAEVASMPRRWGIGTARRVLAHADSAAESPGETRTRFILVQGGYEVDSQVVIRDERGGFVARVDFKLRDAPVVVEFDGRSKYAIGGDVEAAHWREKLRHDALGDAGLEVARVVWADSPSAVLNKVDVAVRRAARRR